MAFPGQRTKSNLVIPTKKRESYGFPPRPAATPTYQNAKGDAGSALRDLPLRGISTNKDKVTKEHCAWDKQQDQGLKCHLCTTHSSSPVSKLQCLLRRKLAHPPACSVSSLGHPKASQTESMQTPNSLPPANGCSLLLPRSFCPHPSRCSSQKLLVTFNISLSQYLHQQILSPLCPPTFHQSTATTLASCSLVIPAASRLRALTPHHHLPPVPFEHGRPRSLCKPACGVCWLLTTLQGPPLPSRIRAEGSQSLYNQL